MRTLRSFARRNACLAGLLCLLLLLFGTTIQLTHTHLSGENHADCALCVTAHAAVAIVLPPSGFVAPITPVERPAPQAPHRLARQVLAHPLWNRPPPSCLSVA